mmetsp:Transcript_58143/g.138364  ORF Transcript_58143/g.138364 Transcript_58143/m.138364 type:complete len:202 (+) Transcript_58143:983-1588(+)
MWIINSLNKPPPSIPLSGVPSGEMNSTLMTSRRASAVFMVSKAANPSSTRKFRRILYCCKRDLAQGALVSSRLSWSTRITLCSRVTRSSKGSTCGSSSSTASRTSLAALLPPSMAGALRCDGCCCCACLPCLAAPSASPGAPCSSTCMSSSSSSSSPAGEGSGGASVPRSTTGALRNSDLASGMCHQFVESPPTCSSGRRT